MHRCLALAALASGNVAPNPMVGSVLVYKNRILGEGYHQAYGQAHAEVNCLASVNGEDHSFIQQATLYVSLEPCAHFGKTPPCADMIIEKKISKVVIGCRDPFAQVNGKGIEKLIAAGVEVEIGVLEKECIELNRRFFLFHTEHRPYVVLKWAQTHDRFLAGNISSRLKISNPFTDRLVHKWRSEEAGILIGTNTAVNDDPQLGTRLWPVRNPVRIVVDMNRRLPKWLKLFDGTIPTIVFNKHEHTLPVEKLSAYNFTGIQYYQITEDVSIVHQILNGLYRLGIQSILMEGGAQLLQSFIDEEAWDEARVITNESLQIGVGLPAPRLKNAVLMNAENVFSDVIHRYKRYEP